MRRFITLVDALYEGHVTLVLLAQAQVTPLILPCYYITPTRYITLVDALYEGQVTLVMLAQAQVTPLRLSCFYIDPLQLTDKLSYINSPSHPCPVSLPAYDAAATVG